MPSPWTRVRRAVAAAGALAAVAGGSGDRRLAIADAPAPIEALAPVEVVAPGVRQPSAVAVDGTGAVLVADRAAGTLTRIGVDGRFEVIARALQAPIGVAVDRSGEVFVAESGARRLVRIGEAGSTTVVASLDGRPKAMAIGPDDRMWVAVRGERQPRRDDVLLRVEESGALTEVAGGFKDVGALAASRDAVYVGLRSAVARVAILEHGAAGDVERLVTVDARQVSGLGVDAVGGLFLSAGVSVLKRQRAGAVTEFARRLAASTALALAPGGDLIALELRHGGRVVRFRGPPAPEVHAPRFASRSPLPVGGRARPGDRVHMFDAPDRREQVADTVADARGAFTLQAPLAPNARTALLFRATAHGGAGLTGRAAEAVIVHDDVLPRVFTLDPPAGAHVRGAVVLRARAEDEGSGVAAVSFLLDDSMVARVENPDPAAPISASAVLDPGGLIDGPHAWAAAAADRAGNVRVEARLLIVDRAPPETVVASGPGAETLERTVRFGLAGTDVWSPSLEFSWRLDEGTWSPYAAATSIELRDLAPGPHRLEARARDQAGNEDPTPAAYPFVIHALRVRVLEPVEGARITSRSMWVRGTVEAGIGEVVVGIVPPPGFAGVFGAPIEAGTFAIEVPADPAFAVVTVMAADGSGNTAQASVSVLIAPDDADAGSLDVWPPGGVAPLPVRVGLYGFSGVPVSIDLEGDGTDEFAGVLDADDVRATYARPGIYVPSVRVATPAGTVVRRGLVQVYDLVALDARVQAVWGGFRQALGRGDIRGALSYIVAARRDGWSEYFGALPPETLQQVDDLLAPITFVNAGAGGAQYEMVVEQDDRTLSYAVWFQIDADGRWRLWRF